MKVYRCILQFYKAAFEVLTKARGKLMFAIIKEQNRLQSIMEEFSSRANELNKVVQNPTLKIKEVESMLIERRGMASVRWSHSI